MRIEKEFNKNEYVFDNLKDINNIQSITIENEIIVFDFNEIINTQFKGGNVPEKVERYKAFLNLGMYSKAPDGGFVNFYQIKWQNRNYILYSSVNEVYNSHYIVTIYKLLIDDDYTK